MSCTFFLQSIYDTDSGFRKASVEKLDFFSSEFEGASPEGYEPPDHDEVPRETIAAEDLFVFVKLQAVLSAILWILMVHALWKEKPLHTKPYSILWKGFGNAFAISTL